MKARRATLPSLLGALLLAASPAFARDEADAGVGAHAADAGTGPRKAGAGSRPRAADTGTDPPAADAPGADPDQEIIDHLDELQQMELLQNLELFDSKAAEER